MADKKDPEDKYKGFLVKMPKDLRALIDKAATSLYQQSSQFVREACVEKLERMGYKRELEKTGDDK